MEVSAKYKGAFCEAKVKHVEKSVKCKVCTASFVLHECVSIHLASKKTSFIQISVSKHKNKRHLQLVLHQSCVVTYYSSLSTKYIPRNWCQYVWNFQQKAKLAVLIALFVTMFFAKLTTNGAVGPQE